MNIETKKVLLTQIRIDGGTQLRDLCLETVALYSEAMKAGEIFPPVLVYYDGMHYWLSDGFHRFHAKAKAGIKHISAIIHNGTQRDALWMAFSANKTHGLPRKPGVLAEILRRIYDDADWSKVSQVEISKHVGCTQQLVSKHFKQFAEQEAHPTTSCRIDKTNDVQKRQTKLEVQRGGQKYEMSVPSKGGDTKEDIVDSAGNTVPKGLKDIFGRKDDIQDFLDDLNRIHRCITELMTKGDPLWRCFNYNAFDAEIKNLKDVFTIAKPFSVCGYCGGKVGNMDCRACEGSGWVNKRVYIATPEEFKKIKNEPN